MGNPRSGTTALGNLLNAHSRVVVGRERFVKHKRPTRAHFERERFFFPTEADANNIHQELYDKLLERYDTGVDWIGDKVPFYTRQLSFLTEEFPDARMIFLLRDLIDVAASYERRLQSPEDHWKRDYRIATRGWNENLRHALRYLGTPQRCEMMILSYERFFSGDPAQLTAVLGFLGLKEERDIRKQFKSRTAGWDQRPVGVGKGLTDTQRAWVESQRDEALEAGLRRIAEVHEARYAAAIDGP